MSDTITFTIPRAATELIARCRDRAGLLNALRGTMDTQNESTVGHITARRLTGKGPFAPSLHKLGTRSNRLRQSLRRSATVIVGEGIRSTIGSNVKYAGIHEFGGTTRPHVIRPKNKKALAFLVGGKKVVAKSVNHPGSRIPRRAPIFHGIQDRRERYGRALGATAINFIRGGQR